MDWFAVFDALEQTWLAMAIKESLWYFPAIEAVWSTCIRVPKIFSGWPRSSR